MADAPTTSQDAYLIDPSGETVAVPAEHVPQYLQGGEYTPANKDQARYYELQKQYGNPLDQLATGAAAAASVLTFGASDAIAGAIGGDKLRKTMRLQEEANPKTHLASGVVGLGLGALIPGADEFAAPGLISKVGARAAEAVVPEFAATALKGTAGAAAKALRGGIDLATQGALFGGQQVVHEAALGDPNLTAENALATIGYSALGGGALGVGGGVLGHLAGAAAEKFGASDIANTVQDWLGEKEGEANAKAAGAIQSDLNKAAIQKGGRDNVLQIAREGRDYDLVSAFSTPSSTLEKSNALRREAGSEMGSILDKADAAIPEKGGPDIENVVNRARDTVLKDLESNPLQSGAAATLKQNLEGYESKFADGMTFGDLHGIRQQLDESIYGMRGAMDPLSTKLKESYGKVRQIVADELSSSLEDAHGAGAAWKAANRKYEVGAQFSRWATKGLERNAGNNVVSPLEFLATLHSGPVAGLATAAVRRFGAGLRGAGARALRDSLGESADAVGSKTAELLAAERQAAAHAAEQEAPIYRRLDTSKLGEVEIPSVNLAEKRTQARLADINGAYGQPNPMRISGGAASPDELPPINIGMTPEGKLTVEDGHHRLFAARQHGAKAINARLVGGTPEKWNSLLAAGEQPLRAKGPIESTMSRSPEAAAALGALHKTNGAMQSKIDAAVSTLVRGGAKAANVARGETVAGISSEFADHDLTRAIYDKRVKQIRDAAVPEAMSQAITSHTSDMQEHAPASTQALSIAYPRMIAHLQSKIPSPPPRGILGTTPEPTKAQQREFIHRTNAALDPLHVVKQAAAGTITPAALDTLKTVYPAMHQAISDAAMAKIASHGPQNVPRSQHAALSFLLGQQLDASVGGQAIMRNQSAFKQPTAAPSAPSSQVKPTQGGLSKIDVANRSLTPSQASAGRR